VVHGHFTYHPSTMASNIYEFIRATGSRSMRIAEATIYYALEKPQTKGLNELKLKLNTPLEKALYHAAMTIAKLIEYQKEKEMRKNE